jgi:hypothetical protein
MAFAAVLVLSRDERSSLMGIMLAFGWDVLISVMRGSALDGLRAQR